MGMTKKFAEVTSSTLVISSKYQRISGDN